MKLNLKRAEHSETQEAPQPQPKPKSKRISLFVLLSLQIAILGAAYAYYVDNGGVYERRVTAAFSNLWTRVTAGIDAMGLTKIPAVLSRGLWQSFFGETPDVIYLQVPHTSVMALDAARQQKLETGPDAVYSQDHNRQNRHQKARMVVNGEEYKIKMRTKGDRSLHYEDPLHQSYRIDIRGEKRFRGMEEFNVHKPIARNYTHEWVFHKLIAEGGLIAPKYEFANLHFNGVDAGLYAIEESFGKELIERNRRRYGPIYGIDETKGINFPDVLFEAYSETYWQSANPELLRNGYSILNSFRGSSDLVREYFDLDAWAYYFAVADLTTGWHGTAPKSVKFYFNPVTAKIEPVSFDGHPFISDQTYLLIDVANSEGDCGWICDSRAFYRRFFLNSDGSTNRAFTSAYLGYLDDLSAESGVPDFLERHGTRLRQINNLIYADFSRTDRVFWKGVGLFWFEYDDYHERIRYVRQRIAESGAERFVVQNAPGSVRVESFGASLPARLRVTCDASQDVFFDGYVFGEFELEKTKSCATVSLHTLKDGWIDQTELASVQLSRDGLPVHAAEFPLLTDYDLAFTTEDNVVRMTSDFARLAGSAHVPPGMTLQLRAGQTLELAPNTVLYVSGILVMAGSKDRPAQIVGRGRSALGGGSVVLDGGRLNARHAAFSGLGAPNLSGRILYGGVNVISGTAYLEEVTVSHSQSEDAINFIASSVDIASLTVNGAKSDGLDFDFSVVNFENIYCHDIQNDCLDTSGTTIEGGRVVARNIGDKGLSLGEGSSADIERVIIDKGEIGIVVKDSSVAQIDTVELSDVELAIAVFEKKQEYGPANLVVAELTNGGAENLFLVDHRSGAMINGTGVDGAGTGAEIEARMYGNEFGRATVR